MATTTMAERARKRREELGLSTKDMAHSLGVTTQRLQQMESAGVKSIDIAQRWAKALDMDPVLLIFGKRKG